MTSYTSSHGQGDKVERAMHTQTYVIAKDSELAPALGPVPRTSPQAESELNSDFIAPALDLVKVPVKCPNCRHQFELSGTPLTVRQYVWIPQRPYKPRQNFEHSSKDSRESSVKFTARELDRFSPMPLSYALNNHFGTLDGRDDSILLSDKVEVSTVSIRIEWPGYAPATFTVKTHDWTTSRHPIKKFKLGLEIAKGLKSWIESLNVPIAPGFEQWQVGSPFQINLDTLYLAAVHHVSKGSWQPELYYGPDASVKNWV